MRVYRHLSFREQRKETGGQPEADLGIARRWGGEKRVAVSAQRKCSVLHFRTGRPHPECQRVDLAQVKRKRKRKERGSRGVSSEGTLRAGAAGLPRAGSLELTAHDLPSGGQTRCSCLQPAKGCSGDMKCIVPYLPELGIYVCSHLF